MPVDPRLLQILRCPSCSQPVSELPDSSGLSCPACRRVYPVVDGIPVMLIEEAKTATG